MRRVWTEMVTTDWDRLRGYVGSNIKTGVIRPGEFDDALSEAGKRLTTATVWNFEGVSVGQWRQYLKAVAWRGAQDVQRKNAKLGAHETPYAFDREKGDERSAPSKFDEAAMKLDEGVADRLADAEAVAEAEREREAFFAWAIPQLPEKRRAVWVRLDAGVPVSEIAAELGIKAQDVYSHKRHAITQFIKLKRSYDA